MDERGQYRPLFDGFCKAISEWHREKAMWDVGYRWHYGDECFVPRDDGADETYAEYSGDAPDPADYMPDWDDVARTHIQMYENTTEGTPISPVMETPEELARWLTDNGASAFGGMTATYDQWLATIHAGWAVSAVCMPGVGMTSGVAFQADHKPDA